MGEVGVDTFYKGLSDRFVSDLELDKELSSVILLPLNNSIR